MARGDALALHGVRDAVDGADVVVNLAGATLADGRLDAPHRRKVMQSRVDSTNALVAAWKAATEKPGVWLQASAVGFYGDTGDDEVDEDAPKGSMFLSEVCDAWESAARALESEEGSPRIIVARIGLVLADDAPALEKLMMPIRFGAGGPLGSGKQWWAWIDADDLANAFLWLAENPDAEGVYNMTAPEPVRQIELSRTIARELDRPCFVPAPAFALRLALGAVADELLLPSCRAVPARLQEAGYEFQAADLEQAVARYVEP